jgi:putative transposase
MAVQARPAARYIVLNPVRTKMVKNPGRYPWSSYPATVGVVASPSWLSTHWLLSQFAKTRPVAQRRYAEFVAQGRNLPSPWPELKGQVLLGSEAFAAKMRLLLEGKGELTEIPRAQRWAHRPRLKSLFSARVRQDKPQRDAAMRRACLEYGYTMAAIAREAGIHYSTVSKVIKGER